MHARDNTRVPTMNKVVVVGILVFVFTGIAALAFVYLYQHQLSKTSALLGLRMSQDTLVEPQSGQVLPYRLYSPKRKEGQESVPLVVVLHGAGGRGSDNKKQLDYLSYFFTQGAIQKHHPSFVVTPQCPTGMEWNAMLSGALPLLNYDMSKMEASWREHGIERLVEHLMDRFPIDPERIYVVGYSMGSSGIWSLLVHKPELFSAALLLSGRGDPAMVKHIQTPLWVFHGDGDTVAPLKNSQALVAALLDLNKPAKLSVIEGGHNIVKQSLDFGVASWLFSQGKSSGQTMGQSQ